MLWIECCVLAIVAILSTIALTPLAKRIAIKLNAIDYPDNRRVNKKPIPRMGGIAIYGGMVVSVLVMMACTELFGWVNPFVSYVDLPVNYPLLFLGVTAMFVVGIVDDIKDLRAPVKFFWQIVAATIVAMSGLLLSSIQNPFEEGHFIEFGWWSYPITIFYLVAFANIINLIDGLDGLASGISAISGATIFAFAMISMRFDAAFLSIIVVGVCIGFLKSNHHPASIFMGDSGALLLGISLGVVSLLAIARSTLFISLLVPILTAGVPITDTAVAIIRRTRAHQRVDQADAGHIHHRLMNEGFSQETTVLIMCGWTAVLSVCSIVLAESDGVFRIAAIVVAAVVTGFAIFKLHLLEPVLRHHYVPRKSRREMITEKYEAIKSRHLSKSGSLDRHSDRYSHSEQRPDRHSEQHSERLPENRNNDIRNKDRRK